jgi:hypothetical protein
MTAEDHVQLRPRLVGDAVFAANADVMMIVGFEKATIMVTAQVRGACTGPGPKCVTMAAIKCIIRSNM